MTDDQFTALLRSAVSGNPVVPALTVSLLKLSDKVNKPVGDGLHKVVLCTETSPDDRLNLAQ